MTGRILITGSAGRIGAMLRPRLAAPGRVLRLLDRERQEPAAPGEAVELVECSVTDLDAMTAACEGADAVVHLGGLSGEAAWEDILHTNIHGTYVALEAARRAGVGHVVLASSNHAAGFHPVPGGAGDLPDDLPPRPDTYYGVSKVAGEALGSLYHDRYGLDVVCLRIGSCAQTPPDARALATWLSPDDCARLVEAALTATGFRIVWGVSANTRRRFSLDGGAALGHHPVDDAEAFATAELESAVHGHDRYVGGRFCSPELDAEVPPR